MKNNITNEDMEKVNQATIRNIISKIKSGKVPTKYERQLLEEAKTAGDITEIPTDNWPKHTKRDTKMRDIIMEQFRLSERKAYKWLGELKNMKRANGWPVQDVLSSVQDRKDAANGTGGPLVDLKRQLLEEQIRGYKIGNDQKAGLLVLRTEVETDHHERCTRMLNAVKGFITEQSALKPKFVDYIEGLGEEVLRVLNDAA